MRLLDLAALARTAALISCAVVLSACPKKEEAAPEPAATAAQAPVSDKAGVEPAAPAPAAAPAKKKDDDKGGW